MVSDNKLTAIGRKMGLFAVLLLPLLSGCVVRHGDFSVVSNKLVRLSELDLDQADRARGIVGEDKQHIVCIIPIGGVPTLEGAIDDALEKGAGDVVTDAVISAWSWYIPYIYGQSGWAVKGDVVKTRRN